MRDCLLTWPVDVVEHDVNAALGLLLALRVGPDAVQQLGRLHGAVREGGSDEQHVWINA